MLNTLFRSNTPVPEAYRKTFHHLYWDIAWFGILSGSSMAFLSVYAARLGASTVQVGLLGAMPAVINLMLAIPSGQWLQRRSTHQGVFWTAALHRLGYLLWIPLPWLFDPGGEVWALITLSLLMGIPGTALAVGFNALFAEAVPPEWRAHVAGIRNVMLSIVYVITSLVSGFILENVPFPVGYQIVFGLGFIGAAMSTYHLYFVRPTQPPASQAPAKPAESAPEPLRAGLRRALRTDVWRGPFGRTLLVLLGFHLAQYAAVPIFPIYFVRQLHLTDDAIGIGTALFYLTVLIGSTQLARVSHRYGHKTVTGVGVALMSIYPILLTFARDASLYWVTSFIGGFIWAMVGGALANYLLEKVPGDDRPAHLAWYNIVLNAAILLGSLGGPAIADQIGLVNMLLLAGGLRLLAGLLILRLG
ncbi:MAG: MFS transporter [Anaerolineales bacterium]